MHADLAPSVADARRGRDAIRAAAGTRDTVEFWAGDGVYVRGRIMEVTDETLPDSRTRTSCTVIQLRVLSVDITETTEIKL